MKRWTAFALTCLTLMGGALAVMLQVVREPGERRALTLGAGVAFVAQLGTFGVARALARRNVIAGWSAGVAIRFLTLVVFAVVAVPRFGVPVAVPLVGVAVFFFLSTVVEPLFLRP
jgi:hypothetical protein